MTKTNFDLQSAGKTPAQLALIRHNAMNAAKTFGRLRIDAEASNFEGYGIVVSVRSVDGDYLTIELDSVDEALAFVAEANGETVADVEATARMFAEYLHNVRTGKRVPAKGKRTKRE